MRAALRKLAREPNLLVGLTTAGVNMAVLLEWWELEVEQIAGINVFAAALFAAVRFMVTPSGEVVAQRKPGEQTLAGPAAESGVDNIPAGTPVELVTGPQPPQRG